jgi:hypothetical protein
VSDYRRERGLITCQEVYVRIMVVQAMREREVYVLRRKR